MRRESPRIALATSGTFPLKLMERFLKEGWLKLLITKPPAPRGRGLKLKPMPPVEHLKNLSEDPYLKDKVDSLRIIEVSTFKDKEKKREVISALESVDVLLVCDFGLFIPGSVRRSVKYSLNLHPSLLPAYRGASPIERALLKGEKLTGLTLALLTGELDAGPIIARWEVEISQEDDRESLREKLSSLASEVVPSAILRLLRGEIQPTPQEGEVSYAPKVEASELHLIKYEEPEEFVNAVRAFKPGGYLMFRDRRLRVLRASLPSSQDLGILESDRRVDPWTLRVSKIGRSRKLFLKLPKGWVELLEVQPEGKRVMKSEQFINGYRPDGEVVG